jgi:hypothetical protein
MMLRRDSPLLLFKPATAARARGRFLMTRAEQRRAALMILTCRIIAF